MASIAYAINPHLTMNPLLVENTSAASTVRMPITDKRNNNKANQLINNK